MKTPPGRRASVCRPLNQLDQTMGAKGRRRRRRILDATLARLRSIPLHELSLAQSVKQAQASTF